MFSVNENLGIEITIRGSPVPFISFQSLLKPSLVSELLSRNELCFSNESSADLLFEGFSSCGSFQKSIQLHVNFFPTYTIETINIIVVIIFIINDLVHLFSFKYLYTFIKENDINQTQNTSYDIADTMCCSNKKYNKDTLLLFVM